MAFDSPNQYFQTHTAQTGNISQIYSRTNQDWFSMMQPWYDTLNNWYQQNQAMGRQQQQQQYEAPFKERELGLQEQGLGIERERLGETKRANLVTEGLEQQKFGLSQEEFEQQKLKDQWEREYNDAYLAYLKAKDAADRNTAKDQMKMSLRQMMEAYGEKTAGAGQPTDPTTGRILWDQKKGSVQDVVNTYAQAVTRFLQDPAYKWLTPEEKKELVESSKWNFQSYLLGFVPEPVVGTEASAEENPGGLTGLFKTMAGNFGQYVEKQKEFMTGITPQEQGLYTAAQDLVKGYEDLNVPVPAALKNLMKQMQKTGTVDINDVGQQIQYYSDLLFEHMR